MPGTIYSPDHIFVRVEIGSATGQDGAKYDLGTSVDGQPLIRSSKTGKTFSLSWNELLNMAVDAGIDEQDEAPHAP
jgi:hypothetical protein